MRMLVPQLRSVQRKLKQANFSRERAAAISDALPVIERAIEMLARYEQQPAAPPLDTDVVLLLTALGKGQKLLGREYYVNDTEQFDRAARRLFDRFGLEEIKL